ncbi:hypothetical protein QWA68_016042 [Fusarium oxysporum]|nr:hypothetical protein QWA68_016042 [Fusarium oxysporum]
MAYATDNGHDSSSTRSGGRSTDSLVLQSSVMTRPRAQASSNYASNVFSDSQNQNQSGGIPGTPVSVRSRRSGGWDRQTLSPAAAARAGVDDSTIEDHAVYQPSSLRPKEDLDDSSDSSDSSDEYMTSYRPLER